MRTLFCVLLVAAGPVSGLAGDSHYKVNLEKAAWSWAEAPFTTMKRAPDPAPDTNAVAPEALSPWDRFLEFATTPVFPRWNLQREDHLGATTLGVQVDYNEGEPYVCTPVGLGLSEAEAVSCLVLFSEALWTNLDQFEYAYRAALVPCGLGGPGLSFAEAEQAALRVTLGGEKWPDPSERALALAECEPAWLASLRVPYTGLAGAIPGPYSGWSYGYYDFPSTFLGMWNWFGYWVGSHGR